MNEWCDDLLFGSCSFAVVVYQHFENSDKRSIHDDKQFIYLNTKQFEPSETKKQANTLFTVEQIKIESVERVRKFLKFS